ncbi:DinB family protein [Chryseosolibacter indicus]|uniref:DinB family protein n=1 Tax=Chryseosolibacter indicus TaxID=2782351 RepID=A0ABS5VUR8_9BACT|nr:DinB family protein [Chryseosolibacter indicus]MBT1705178.1 DinB family protein [Chryseosolibacter indicus]
MHLQNITTRLLRYNLWANERLTSWLMTLDRKILYTKTGSSFGTIDRTLQHIFFAQLYWHTILVKGQIKEFNDPEEEHIVEKIIAELMMSSQQLINDLSVLNQEQLIQIVQASDSTQSRYEYILHLVNHGSYHRGQIVTMCRALGITDEIPVTDYDAYLWWIENM